MPDTVRDLPAEDPILAKLSSRRRWIRGSDPFNAVGHDR
jgi:hypothetical protein